MSRTALARAYRPRRFSEVATQEHVSATLRTAVQRDRVAHAYLFCGPRGVGKTTLARVLAMALNCPDRTAEGEPCGNCDSCQRIWAGKTSLDVVEIDAASNRGVDDARDLRERAMYAPSEHDRFKVYIIDEAHMLTREAWNALLKILEEPPPRVIFVFATTEPQKIQQAAPPILSRCQRFDFHRIGTADLVARMREVLAAEKLEVGDNVLLPIAQKADGGMRDALSLLDQVLSFTEGQPSGADVRRVLGLVEDELYLELAEIVADRRHAAVFDFVGTLLAKGYDLAEFYRGLADFIRALLVLKLNGAAAEIRPDLQEGYAAAAERFAAGDLLRMLSQVAELDADGRFRKSGQQQILIEMLLLRFAYLDRTVSIEDVLSALSGGRIARSTEESESSQGSSSAAPAGASEGRQGEPAKARSGRAGATEGEGRESRDSNPTARAVEGPSKSTAARDPIGDAASASAGADGSGGSEAGVGPGRGSTTASAQQPEGSAPEGRRAHGFKDPVALSDGGHTPNPEGPRTPFDGRAASTSTAPAPPSSEGRGGPGAEGRATRSENRATPTSESVAISTTSDAADPSESGGEDGVESSRSESREGVARSTRSGAGPTTASNAAPEPPEVATTRHGPRSGEVTPAERSVIPITEARSSAARGMSRGPAAPDELGSSSDTTASEASSGDPEISRGSRGFGSPSTEGSEARPLRPAEAGPGRPDDSVAPEGEARLPHGSSAGATSLMDGSTEPTTSAPSPPESLPGGREPLAPGAASAGAGFPERREDGSVPTGDWESRSERAETRSVDGATAGTSSDANGAWGAAASEGAPAGPTSRPGSGPPTRGGPAYESPAATRPAEGLTLAEVTRGASAEQQRGGGLLELAAVRRAWRSILEEGSHVPGGMGLVLRGAEVSLTGPRAIRVAVPPGSPVLEGVGKKGARRPLEEALSNRLGAPVTLEIVSAAAESSEPSQLRITADGARQDRLRRLTSEEPLLEAAVQEWDLELLE